jgi:hypothetical protein
MISMTKMTHTIDFFKKKLGSKNLVPSFATLHLEFLTYVTPHWSSITHHPNNNTTHRQHKKKRKHKPMSSVKTKLKVTITTPLLLTCKKTKKQNAKLTIHKAFPLITTSYRKLVTFWLLIVNVMMFPFIRVSLP